MERTRHWRNKLETTACKRWRAAAIESLESPTAKLSWEPSKYSVKDHGIRCTSYQALGFVYSTAHRKTNALMVAAVEGETLSMRKEAKRWNYDAAPSLQCTIGAVFWPPRF